MDTKILEEWLQTGFPRLLWDALQLCGYDRRPVYNVITLPAQVETEYAAEIKIVAKNTPDSRPWFATGLRVNTPALAVEMVAREALVCFRGFLPEMKQRATFYLPYKGSIDTVGGPQDPINEEVALAYQTRFAFAGEMVLSALADDYRHLRMEVRQLRHRIAVKESGERRQRMLGTPGAGPSKFKAPKRNTARRYLAQFKPIQPPPPEEEQPEPSKEDDEDMEEDQSDSVADPAYSPTHPYSL